MEHTIKNQHDRHITDTGKHKFRQEIEHMLDKGLDGITINNTRITVLSDYRKDDSRETIVEVEWLDEKM